MRSDTVLLFCYDCDNDYLPINDDQNDDVPHRFLHDCAHQSVCNPTLHKSCAYGFQPLYILTPHNYGMRVHHLRCVDSNIPHCAYAFLFPYTLLYRIYHVYVHQSAYIR